MKILSELASLDASGVSVWAQDGKLKYACVEESLDENVRSRLLAVKSEVLEFWQDANILPRETSGLQQAYWLGESSAFDQHSPAFLHLIFKGDLLDQTSLQQAMEHLVRRHPPLGYTLDQHYPVFKPLIGMPEIESMNAAQGTQAECSEALGDLSGLVPTLESESALFRLILVNDGSTRCLHGIFRLALFDAYSIHIVMDELMRLARGEDLPALTGAYEFNAFHQYEFGLKRARVKAREYWKNKIPTLPGPAMLPLASATISETVANSNGNESPSERAFREHRYCLPVPAYQRLQDVARQQQVSVNAVLISCYLATLSRWSESKPVCASVMYSQRNRLPEQHQGCIGNFGNLLLLGSAEMDQPLSAQASEVQSDLFQAMNHAAYDGVSVIRDWRAYHGYTQTGSEPPMPFVFSTLLGMSLQDFELEQVSHRMKTPQIWIDAQAFETDDGLILSWDELEGIFGPGVVDQMFEYFTGWVGELAEGGDVWNRAAFELPDQSRQLISQSNDTRIVYPVVSLLDGLFETAQSDPGRIAFYHRQGNLTFAELLALSSQLATHLNENGVGPGDNVLVIGERTPQLAIAVYGVLMAGATYVPVIPSMPAEKIKRIITQSAATTILADNTVAIDEIMSSPVVWYCDYAEFLQDFSLNGETGHQSQVSLEYLEPAYPLAPEQLAYIIFTSGSTGVPKGVAVTHAAAVNTLQSCTRLYNISPADRVLGISELNFDLSVFDLFMPALVGCSTIIVEGADRTDPALWLDAAERFQATVWNSVPAIMEMACLYTDEVVSRFRFPPSLRLFMASGDWIPLTLPGRIRESLPESVFIAMGGATEAAIWSNYHQVTSVDPSWRSIPYGKPLDNQQYYILDRYGRQCPVGVAGTLHIGGSGLAEGYFNDKEKSAERFFYHSEIQCRLYNTGDQGRYLFNGDIEFLGRDDFQVKINGYRVELSEIEHVATGHDLVKQAVASYSRKGDAVLHLFYVTTPRSEPNLISEDLRCFLKRHLSDYMVPQRLHPIDEIPLTSNGKVDRKALEALIDSAVESQTSDPLSEIEHKARDDSASALDRDLLAIVKNIVPAIENIHQNWFQRGCSSLQALHLIHAINQALKTRLQLPDVYSAPSVRALSRLLEAGADAESNIVWLNESEPVHENLVVFVHPVGGAVSCYLDAAGLLKQDHDVLALCATFGQTECTIESLAADYLGQLEELLCRYRTVTFAGWSLGGAIALELARLARNLMGSEQLKVVTVDSYVGHHQISLDEETLLRRFINDLERVSSVRIDAGATTREGLEAIYQSRYDLFKRNYLALAAYSPALSGNPSDIEAIPIMSFAAESTSSMPGLVPLSSLLDQRCVTTLKADHYTILSPPALIQWVEAMKKPVNSRQKGKTEQAPTVVSY